MMKRITILKYSNQLELARAINHIDATHLLDRCINHIKNDPDSKTNINHLNGKDIITTVLNEPTPVDYPELNLTLLAV